MTRNKASSIKNWIKTMGFQLTRSHQLDKHKKKINYYTLGNFGVYEETVKSQRTAKPQRKFTSWTPWGDNIEVNSISDLWQAYEDFANYNPNTAVRN